MIVRSTQLRGVTAAARRLVPSNARRGAALVEAAVVLGIFLILLLGSLDLMLTVFRDNTLAQAARRLARAAIVRGESVSGFAEPWGPDAYSGTADDDTDQAAAIRDVLVAVDPADVQIQISWPDAGNAAGDRVEVVVSMQHQPIVASLFGVDPYRLTSTSTMQIEH
jgi:hypothetical protein